MHKTNRKKEGRVEELKWATQIREVAKTLKVLAISLQAIPTYSVLGTHKTHSQ